MSGTTATETDLAGLVAEAVDRRRNFAIISHPDAGKTTLTEKLPVSYTHLTLPTKRIV